MLERRTCDLYAAWNVCSDAHNDAAHEAILVFVQRLAPNRVYSVSRVAGQECPQNSSRPPAAARALPTMKHIALEPSGSRPGCSRNSEGRGAIRAEVGAARPRSLSALWGRDAPWQLSERPSPLASCLSTQTGRCRCRRSAILPGVNPLWPCSAALRRPKGQIPEARSDCSQAIDPRCAWPSH